MTEPRYIAVSCGNHRIELPEGATMEEASIAAGKVLRMAADDEAARCDVVTFTEWAAFMTMPLTFDPIP